MPKTQTCSTMQVPTGVKEINGAYSTGNFSSRPWSFFQYTVEHIPKVYTHSISVSIGMVGRTLRLAAFSMAVNMAVTPTNYSYNRQSDVLHGVSVIGKHQVHRARYLELEKPLLRRREGFRTVSISCPSGGSCWPCTGQSNLFSHGILKQGGLRGGMEQCIGLRKDRSLVWIRTLKSPWFEASFTQRHADSRTSKIGCPFSVPSVIAVWQSRQPRQRPGFEAYSGEVCGDVLSPFNIRDCASLVAHMTT